MNVLCLLRDHDFQPLRRVVLLTELRCRRCGHRVMLDATMGPGEVTEWTPDMEGFFGRLDGAGETVHR